jgi:hypothetical protein
MVPFPRLLSIVFISYPAFALSTFISDNITDVETTYY